MNTTQHTQWLADRERQAKIGTNPPRHGSKESRGDLLRRLNNGIALRTFRHIKGRP